MIPMLPRHALLGYPLESFEARSGNGVPIRLWRRGSVPRIDDALSQCIIYLYPTVDDAQTGRREGGTGFWVGVRSEKTPFWHPYAVTNSHVVRRVQGKSLVLRINQIGGGFDTIQTDESGWIHHPNGDDVAVHPLDLSPLLQMRHVSVSSFVSQEIISKYNIGPGNDVVMPSRVISHDGKLVNTPALRFGNISMMPLEPVLNELGIKQDSFLVECRSLAGSSGSPVFVQWSIHDHFLPNGVPMFQKEGGPWLLGIVWGHLRLVDPDFEYVRDNQGEILSEKLKVWVNTGIMQVAPAWKIREILDLPELQERRRLEEVELIKRKGELLAAFDAQGLPELKRLFFPDPVT